MIIEHAAYARRASIPCNRGVGLGMNVSSKGRRNEWEPRTNVNSAYFRLLGWLLLPFHVIRDDFDVEKLEVFQAYSYKKAYLSESTAHRIAFLHYLLIGERRGYLPNAFFDPNITVVHNHEMAYPRHLRSI